MAYTRRKFITGTAGALAGLHLSKLTAVNKAFAFSCSGAASNKNIIIVHAGGGMDPYGSITIPFAGDIYDKFRTSLRPTIYVDPSNVIQNVFSPLNGNSIGMHVNFQPLVNAAAGKIRVYAGTGYTGTASLERSHDTRSKVITNGASSIQNSHGKGLIARVMDECAGTKAMQFVGVGLPSPMMYSNPDSIQPLLMTSLGGYQYANRQSTYNGNPAFGAYNLNCDDPNFTPAQKTQCKTTDKKMEIWDDSADVRRTIVGMVNETNVQKPVDQAYVQAYQGMMDSEALVQTYIKNVALADTNFRSPDLSFSYFQRCCYDATKYLLWANGANSTVGNGTRFVQLNRGGFDTHGGNDQSNHATALPNALTDLACGLRGMVMALQANGEWNDTIIVVLTEFGRTLRENSININVAGTDHGEECATMVLGGMVNGGLTGILPTMAELNDMGINAVSAKISHFSFLKKILSYGGIDNDAAIFPEIAGGYPGLDSLSDLFI